MPLIVFRSRLRPGVEAEYGPRADRMLALATTMPGFLSIKDFTAEDGERVAIIEWESHETLSVWRAHPEHRLAQQAGRARYYESYSLQICDVVRDSRFPAR